ncbi:alpha-galactosidase [Butyricicoccus sp.]|uniref:alpha-galactosidase n=1 Tax=Butyricicoccus sp. TaxID=2049021 RepID=UPI003F14D3BA
MSIIFEQKSRTFHLTNGEISYIIKILPNEQLGQLYFGRAVQHRENFDHLLELAYRSMSAYVFEGDMRFSMEHIKQEYPAYGTGDFRHPAVSVLQGNGSRITDFVYECHCVTGGKPKLEGLPATYCETEEEAETLHLFLKDALTGVQIELLYTIFANHPAIARSARFVNRGTEKVQLETAMSLCIDLPDCDYEWLQLSGAWARERHIHTRKLECGIQSVESTRGNSSHNHNPFVVLKRPHTNEMQGEALGFSLVYSGNFLAQAEVDCWGVTRMTMGINPFNFTWKLEPEESFQTPEAVVVYTENGLNGMSQTFHRLYQRRLARGYWRDRVRPILINNWEATYFDFTEEKLLDIALTAKEHGVEMFVLDDGWFGNRCDDTAGLGDWIENRKRLPNGIARLSEKIEQIGLKFGLWFEPEMVNRDSDLFRAHPEWVIAAPGRHMTHGRNQFVLNFGCKEVVDYIYDSMSKILKNAKISYIKWDMNRSITEAFSNVLPSDRQGEVFHRYILGVYDLYERLNETFPQILFESCSSGGGRFDPGLLYYAPQGWASDDSDALERMKIQYGTSLCYPISSIGAHVSKCPNEQVYRNTPIETRANVACFGTFGYELDLKCLTEEEREMVRKQVAFMKEYREVLQFGTFYRLISPFESNFMSWMSVSEDKEIAVVGWYKVLNTVNGAYHRVKLSGLNPNTRYQINGTEIYRGDELMNIGLITTDSSAGQCLDGDIPSCDFDSKLFVLKAVK